MGFFGSKPLLPGAGVPDYLGDLRSFTNAQLPQVPKKGGFFKKDGGFWKAIGALGDGLSGNPVYAQSVMQQRKQEAEAEEYQRRRQDELSDYEKKQEIEARYRAPKDPSEFDQMLTAAGITDPAERQKAYGDLVTNRREGSPYQFDVTGDGLPDIVPRSVYRNMTTGAGQPGAYREGQTAVNPQTGERIVYRGGRWVPASGESRGGNASGGFSGPY